MVCSCVVYITLSECDWERVRERFYLHNMFPKLWKSVAHTHTAAGWYRTVSQFRYRPVIFGVLTNSTPKSSQRCSYGKTSTIHLQRRCVTIYNYRVRTKEWKREWRETVYGVCVCDGFGCGYNVEIISFTHPKWEFSLRGKMVEILRWVHFYSN